MAKLPTRRELQVHFQTSLATIQQALDQLTSEGFIESRGSLGTFVTAEPPHMARYGIVSPMAPHEQGYPRFWVALVNEAQRLHETIGKTVRVYQGVAKLEHSQEFRNLQHDVQRHCLAGLIFVANPFYLEDTDILENPGVPCVAIGSANQMYGNVTPLYFDATSVAKKAVDFLAKRGRKRIGLIGPPKLDSTWRVQFEKSLAENGQISSSFLTQEVSISTPNAARTLTHLLLRLPPAERPDGLVIADDNLVEHATAGIVDAGIRVPDDLDVVAHCNFPWPTPSVVAVRRLGYDAREIIAACIRCIDQQRAGHSNVAPPAIVARFEDELLSAAVDATTPGKLSAMLRDGVLR